MKETLLAYFDGEKGAGLVLAFVGIAKLFVAAATFLRGDTTSRPFAIALGVLGLLELLGGTGLYLKTGPQVAALLDRLAHEPASFYAAESARMAKVQKNFVTLEIVWCAILAVGAIAAVLLKSRPVPAGIVSTLVLTAAILLAFDILAERRGATYYAALREPSAPGPVIKRNPYDP